MNQKVITKSFKETQLLGKKISSTLRGGDVVLLSGELGGGKTTFVQGLANGLNIKKRIISPTFIIVRSYKLNNKKVKAEYFYHVDLYRIDSENDILGMELDEIINDKKNIVAIEWPEKIGRLLPKNRIEINFKYLKDNEREVKIK